ncbi:hypothetical protein SPRG_15130 [Saprolegnia parasitica CBS 223.65]|uniref:Uncharacterized protein n=1 Tax=Saprolegnia parasitica (strain CBS 223.65) TaxID=695850 RepID=A0A067BLM4_SAPPC|nr:hypothetical protein SPRG_15130 [Saprolegnia parasitica CBS 223.65]KDO19389.1 hypothetical protein SPRG_15130 [Saprolegnia parasitica CBS 223.65]|eukprot:XP_012209893.1 hypothetical protein SPRG_15130 [Saprolegnia parasitica CBS 223.65]
MPGTAEDLRSLPRGWIVQARDSKSPEEHAKYLRYCRLKQKGYRERAVSEIKQLAATAAELEARLASAKRQPRVLGWVDVAKALETDLADVRMTNKQLKRLRGLRAQLICTMQDWIGTVLAKPVGANAVSWQLTTLWADPTSRKLGIDWITRARMHNTDSMMLQYGFPSSNVPILDFDMKELENETFEYVWRDQLVLHHPHDLVLDVMRYRLDQTMKGTQWRSPDSIALEKDIVQEIGHTRYQRTLRGSLERPVEYMNFIWREFHLPERTIIVGQNITDDATLHASPQSRYMMFWYVLDRVNAFQTKLRVLAVSSHYFNARGYVSRDDEFALIGYKPTGADENIELARFKYHVSRMYTRTTGMFERDLDSYIATTLA